MIAVKVVQEADLVDLLRVVLLVSSVALY